MGVVEFYHAGMVASRRKAIQNQFMRGDLKIVVATIAFGKYIFMVLNYQIVTLHVCIFRYGHK